MIWSHYTLLDASVCVPVFFSVFVEYCIGNNHDQIEKTYDCKVTSKVNVYAFCEVENSNICSLQNKRCAVVIPKLLEHL